MSFTVLISVKFYTVKLHNKMFTYFTPLPVMKPDVIC